jgi:lysophospholipase L1-like esterase
VAARGGPFEELHLDSRTEDEVLAAQMCRGTRGRIGVGAGLLALLALLLAVAPAHAGDSDVLVVGDSLAVGTLPYLGPMLGGRNIVAAAQNGITTPQGMKLVRRELRLVTPKTVIISLGTNDGANPQRFADRVRRTMSLLPENACAIWATIIRPKRKGAYRGLNRVLHQAKRRDHRIVVVNWEHAVNVGAVYLPDGLHADAAGYRYRSAMIAEAIELGC